VIAKLQKKICCGQQRPSPLRQVTSALPLYSDIDRFTTAHWDRDATKSNAQQRFERLNLYGLVQCMSYVIRLNDLKTAQHLRVRLALGLRRAGGLSKPLHADLKELFAISGMWLRNIGDGEKVFNVGATWCKKHRVWWRR
jgi:hypothetical protein